MNIVRLTYINSNGLKVWVNLDHVLTMRIIKSAGHAYTEVVGQYGDKTRVFNVVETPDQILGTTAHVTIAGDQTDGTLST